MKLKSLRTRGASKGLRWGTLATVVVLAVVLAYVNHAQGPALPQSLAEPAPASPTLSESEPGSRPEPTARVLPP